MRRKRDRLRAGIGVSSPLEIRYNSGVPDPLTMSALELAAAIRRRELSSREIVGAHVERARAINPAVNAIVVERYEHALAEAEAADARVAAAGSDDSLPPLLGVPCTIKESFAVAGLPNTSGLVRRRNVIASEDATAVARLRQAGAICIGLTNVSELCMWMESNNRVYGRSNNPYDPRCIVGGSSGGEGAAVGAGASPFGLGADIGGSIRLPAFFCGVFGHKSTGGLVPGTGMHPISENPALRYLTTGPIARRATDLMPRGYVNDPDRASACGARRGTCPERGAVLRTPVRMSSRKEDLGGIEPAADSADPSLRPLEALKVELDDLEEGAHELAVELPQAWVAEVLAGTDAIAQSGGAVRLELTVQTDRTLLVRGRIELAYAVPCARCLEPATVDVGAETEALCVTFVPADRLRSWVEAPGGADTDDDDIEPLESSELDEIGYHGSTVDLRGLISEQILLAYPMRILCGRGEACLGLCMRCGADLNKLIPADTTAERCPNCNVRLDGVDDEGAETPWKRALAKLEPPKN